MAEDYTTRARGLFNLASGGWKNFERAVEEKIDDHMPHVSPATALIGTMVMAFGSLTAITAMSEKPKTPTTKLEVLDFVGVPDEDKPLVKAALDAHRCISLNEVLVNNVETLSRNMIICPSSSRKINVACAKVNEALGA